jgi:hypothetical protein
VPPLRRPTRLRSALLFLLLLPACGHGEPLAPILWGQSTGYRAKFDGAFVGEMQGTAYAHWYQGGELLVEMDGQWGGLPPFRFEIRTDVPLPRSGRLELPSGALRDTIGGLPLTARYSLGLGTEHYVHNLFLGDSGVLQITHVGARHVAGEFAFKMQSMTDSMRVFRVRGDFVARER